MSQHTPSHCWPSQSLPIKSQCHAPTKSAKNSSEIGIPGYRVDMSKCEHEEYEVIGMEYMHGESYYQDVSSEAS